MNEEKNLSGIGTEFITDAELNRRDQVVPNENVEQFGKDHSITGNTNFTPPSVGSPIATAENQGIKYYQTENNAIDCDFSLEVLMAGDTLITLFTALNSGLVKLVNGNIYTKLTVDKFYEYCKKLSIVEKTNDVFVEWLMSEWTATEKTGIVIGKVSEHVQVNPVYLNNFIRAISGLSQKEHKTWNKWSKDNKDKVLRFFKNSQIICVKADLNRYKVKQDRVVAGLQLHKLSTDTNGNLEIVGVDSEIFTTIVAPSEFGEISSLFYHNLGGTFNDRKVLNLLKNEDGVIVTGMKAKIEAKFVEKVTPRLQANFVPPGSTSAYNSKQMVIPTSIIENGKVIYRTTDEVVNDINNFLRSIPQDHTILINRTTAKMFENVFYTVDEKNNRQAVAIEDIQSDSLTEMVKKRLEVIQAEYENKSTLPNAKNNPVYASKPFTIKQINANNELSEEVSNIGGYIKM